MTTEQAVNTAAQPVDQNPSSQSDSGFSIPDAYKDRGWTSKIKSQDDVFKLIDNQDQLIGKRPAGIPAADAPQEEWDKFYAAAGRPEKHDAYKLTDPEGLPEGADLTEYRTEAMEIMHKAGLTQRQAETLWKEFVAKEMGAANSGKAEYEAKQKELDAEFDKITQEHFGGDFESAQKLTIEMAGKFVPEALRGSFNDAPPAVLAAVAALSKGAHAEIERIKKEYGAEAKITSGNQAAGQDIGEVRKELARLRTSNEARDFLNPKYKETMARIDELSGVVDRHYKK